MDPTLSVSKGCFVFKPEQTKKRHKKSDYEHDAWYPAFKECWQLVEDKIQAIHNTAFSEVLGRIVGYLKSCPADPVFADVVPAVALLTGVCVPDHAALFATVCDKLRQEVTPHIASLYGDECRTIKNALEKLVSQFVNKDQNVDGLDDTITELRVKKNKCTFSVLSAWYKTTAASLPGEETMSTDVNTFCPGFSEKGTHFTTNNSFPCTSKVACGKDSSSACKHELSNENCYCPEKILPCSPRSSAKKLKSPLKQLYTPTKSPRKLMIAKKLLLKSPDIDSTKKLSHSGLKASFGSPCKEEGSTSPLKSPSKVQTPNLYKVKNDLSKSFDNVNLYNCSVPSLEVDRQVLSPTKCVTSPESSPKRQVSKKNGALMKSDCEQLSEYEIRDSVVVLTPLKNGLIASPSSNSKARRQSCKRPASVSSCASPETKKRKNGLSSPSYAVPSVRYSSTPHKANTLTRKPLLVVVLPDFESFSPTVLRDLILIASGYVQELPLVFVFGVATTITAVHRSLPHHVSSKICIQVFQSRCSVDLFNQVVDEL